MKIDPFKILDVPKNATDLEIKKSYVQLVKKWHPDKNNDAGVEKFKEIQEAYSILSDPKKKKEWQ